MTKILFLDVDGTLVDYDGTIPPSAVTAIREARANGHTVCICTGRSRAEVYDELWDIGLDGLIGANGGYVEHEGEVVMHQSLTADQNRRVIEWLGERGSEFYLESNSGLYGSERFEEAGQPVIREYVNRKGDPHADSLTVRQVFPEMIFGGELQRDDINKISYILTSHADLADAEAAFPELHHGSWGGRGGTPLFGDMGVKDIHKAHAIDVLLEHLGADLADTIAFGDATVDRTMLEHCAIGVAMGNAPDDLKAIAQLVTDDVSHDGLAKAFVELGLVAKPA